MTVSFARRIQGIPSTDPGYPGDPLNLGGLQAQASLAAVTATGNGTAVNLGGARSNISIQVTTTGAPAAISLQPQGSLDGTNWFNLGAALVAAGLTFITGSPVNYVRVNLNTLTGGTAPTVTALVSGA